MQAALLFLLWPQPDLQIEHYVLPCFEANVSKRLMLPGWTETLRKAIGLKNVTINDNFFPGHFPQRPIMPGE